jgi:hypothetical protein
MRNLKATVIVINFLLIGSAVDAAVYKSVDQQGNVVYTDEPTGDAKPIELPPLSTVPAPDYRSLDKADSEPEQDPAAGGYYQQLSIVTPKPDETLRDNSGSIGVAVSIKPALNRTQGHRMRYFLDGNAQGEPTPALETQFEDVDRGTHTVEAAVVDASGKELKRTSGVRFYLHRQSLNFPTRQGPAPTPLPSR